MTPYLLFILAVLILEYLLNQTVAILDLRTLDPKLPEEFSDIYSQEKYKKSQEYTRVTIKFSQIQSTVDLILTLAMILLGGFNLVDLFARSFNLDSISTGLIFMGVLGFLAFLLSLPFSVYSTFVIEERFGFNTTTIKTFILDILKGIFLGIIIGAPLLTLVLWFFQTAGDLAWLYVWIAVTLFTLIIQFLAPVLIMPLFNKFTPLEDDELKESITNYVQTQKFAIEGIYTMDGSKRSTRLNAFFTGFGRFRRIVFFDTLMEKLEPDEILGVLAHEMGHFKKKHIFKMMGASILQSGMMFFVLSLFLGNPQLFDAFGMAHISIYASLLFFGFLYSPISMLLAIFFNISSRKYEYEADEWAVKSTQNEKALISGLKKLSLHNLSNLTPHPLDVFLNYSHPPILQRLRAIEALSKE